MKEMWSGTAEVRVDFGYAAFFGFAMWVFFGVVGLYPVLKNPAFNFENAQNATFRLGEGMLLVWMLLGSYLLFLVMLLSLIRFVKKTS
jgi:hypothetical protein